MHEENRDPLENPARLNNNPPTPQDAGLSCDEYMVFAMRDNHHSFSIGLETILICLQAAELEGAVPHYLTTGGLHSIADTISDI